MRGTWNAAPPEPALMSRLPFQLQARATGSQARAAAFRTLHNEVLTPVFMPVGTRATVNAQLPETLVDVGSQVLLANTYHLLLRPGIEVFRSLGGIHRFMNWHRSVLTDSGGYQIFSLPNSRSITEVGAVFRSYVDGRTMLLSPEVSIEAQRAIGSDIMMVLDECVPSTADESTARAALELTHRWARRSMVARGDSTQALFAIVQGALFPQLRKESALGLVLMDFDGYAIGGLAVGEGKSAREDTCALTAEMLPVDKPRYLMGVGKPVDILEAVHCGVDLFDCIIPTQMAQRGGAFTSIGFVQLRRQIYQSADIPLDPACNCPTCRLHSRAYLHHLTKTQETLGWQLIGRHNLSFYHRLMRDIRSSILEDRFLEFYHVQREQLQQGDPDHPPRSVKPKRRKARVLGDYEVHIAQEGFASIRHRVSGEIMHSRLPPMQEARELYVKQSNLLQRLQESERPTPLVLWDVGLGAASNAMAAIECYERAAAKGAVRNLQIVSFENDLDSLRLALRHNAFFPSLHHPAPRALLETGEWQSKIHSGLRWTLKEGNFPEVLSAIASPPDLIFYDMFSGKTHAEAWTLAAFRQLYTACHGKAVQLVTYTCSTAARAGMLAAGFYVARGPSTGAKLETTLAMTPQAVTPRHPLLGEDWLGKWSRSTARFPHDASDEDFLPLEMRIRQHPQFQPRHPSCQGRNEIRTVGLG